MSDGPDPQRCPLCGEPNACAMAAGKCGEGCGPCWCTQVTIPAAVLARVPAEAVNRACICAACAAGQRGRVRD